MPVFFLPPDSIQDQTVTISGPLFFHLRKSLRIQEGETIWLNDHSRTRFLARVSQLGQNSLQAEIITTQVGAPHSSPRVILGQSILKGDRMNWLIQKATELGVSSIMPLRSDRTIVSPKPGKEQDYRTRWQRIALEAAQQSERWDIPEITSPSSFAEFVAYSRHASLRCLLVARPGHVGLLTIPLPHSIHHPIVLAIGPEGGWTNEEIHLATTRNFHTITLGKNILRAETAAIAALSVLQSRLEEDTRDNREVMTESEQKS